MEGESGITRSIFDDIHSSDLQQGQKEGERCVTGSVIDELHSSDMQ